MWTLGFMLEGAGFVTLAILVRNGWPVGTSPWTMVAAARAIILLGYDLIDPRKAR